MLHTSTVIGKGRFFVRVKPHLFRVGYTDEPARQRGGTVYVVFLGTGETKRAAGSQVEAIMDHFSFDPDHDDVFIFDAEQESAYDNVDEYRRLARSTVVPFAAELSDAEYRSLRLTGLSRGGVIALGLAAEVYDAFGRPVDVIALSPALVRPRRLMWPMGAFASLRPLMAALKALPKSFRSGIYHYPQILGTAVMHARLTIDSPELFALAVAEVYDRGAELTEGSVAEFAMLQAADDAALREELAPRLRD
jgi:hypothetical protein